MATITLFAGISVLVVVDLFEDWEAGEPLIHLMGELVILVAAVGGIAVLWWQVVRARRQLGRLGSDLAQARAQGEEWRREARAAVEGLAEAVDRQFDRWGLTDAERDIALLLMKGFSLREIAALRETSERTVRQQSLGIYRKAGLKGRAELAAFFLEDLLLPG
jgi:DNA-binding CsgD family transcriptional regulator